MTQLIDAVKLESKIEICGVFTQDVDKTSKK